MATIECNEERSFRVTFLPDVVIFASVLALFVEYSGSIAFSFIEVFQLSVLEFINDTPNSFCLIGQDVRYATIAFGRLERKCQPVRGQFRPANKLCKGASLFICAQSRFEPYAKYKITVRSLCCSKSSARGGYSRYEANFIRAISALARISTVAGLSGEHRTLACSSRQPAEISPEISGSKSDVVGKLPTIAG